MHPTRLINIDHLAFAEAHRLQQALVEFKHQTGFEEILMLLEHEPVFTMGRRSQESEILVSKEHLKAERISVHRTERGGLITYHGPGQLVAYTIFDLKRMRLGISDLVSGLETVILNTLSDFGIQANRIEKHRGVWVGREKIASIGIAVKKGITFHGLALNYDPNFDHFRMINPCGLDGVVMTSMSKVLGYPIDASKLREILAIHASRHFKLDLKSWSLPEEFYAASEN